MENIISKIKTTRILAAIGIIAVLAGTILPYVTLNINYFGISSITLISYLEGKFIILLLAAIVLFIFEDLVEKHVPKMFESGFGKFIKKADSKLVAVPTALIAATAIYVYSTLNVDSFMQEYIKYGLGAFALWIGIVALIAHSFIYKKEEVK